MILTINNKVPSWWVIEEVVEKPATLGAWWDALEWRNNDFIVDPAVSNINLPSILNKSQLIHELQQWVAYTAVEVWCGIVKEYQLLLDVIM